MVPAYITISASSREEALELAASRLEAPREAVAMEHMGGDEYRAGLVDQNAEVQLGISADGMEASIVEFTPPKGKGRHMTPEDLFLQLKQIGVRIEPSEKTVAAVVEDMKQDKDVINMVLVRGSQPQPARDAVIKPEGDRDFPVFPGEVVGTYVSPRAVEDGMLVNGTKNPATTGQKPSDIFFPTDAGCHLDLETSRVIADQYGLVSMEGQNIRVTPLVHVSEDKMSVKATVFSRTSSGSPTTPELFREILNRMQVMARLREQTLKQAVDKAKEKQTAVENVVICRRLQPKNGQHGYLELAVSSTSDVGSHGQEDSEGNIDYRARDMIRSVQQDDFLGRLVPPQPGVPSQDVFGHTVLAKDGQPAQIEVGENVRVSEDGNEFYATAEGMVVFLNNTLKVTEVFEVNGDVDLAVGNIHLERGSVSISGSVLGGLKVEAPGSVVIGNVVEDAFIHAGGDVQVGCGIVMNHTGRVEAGGAISAMYAQNATLSAGNEVDIAHEIKSCTVFVGGTVNATKGRGKIVGGVLRCGEGIVAREIGSPLGVETLVYMGVDHATEVNLERKRYLEETLQKIYNSLGSGDIKSILERAPKNKRQIVSKVLRTRVECEKELNQIKEQIEREREERRSCEKIRVRALETIHPDVVFYCLKSQFKVTKPLSDPTIGFDGRENKLVLL